jgi:hypothetical protein
MESLIKIEQVTEDLKTIPALIESHKTRVMKAEAVGNQIIAAIEENGGEVTAEIDERANKYLANCSKAKKEMEEARKPATQILDVIRKQFTEQESKLDNVKGPIVSKIQSARDLYAKVQFEAAENKRKEAEAKAAREKALSDFRISVETDLDQTFGNALMKKKTTLFTTFNAITLETFEEKSAALKGLNVEPPEAAIAKLFEMFKTEQAFKLTILSKDEAIAIIEDVVNAFPLEAWKNGFKQQIQEVKDQLIDRLPSLKKELTDQANASAEEAAAIEKRRLERIAYEKKKAEEERIENERIAKEKEESKKAAANAEIMFDQLVDSAATTDTPEARTGFDIVVLHPAGWVEIFQLWFQRKGLTMDVESIGGTKLDSMKTFVEKLAKDEDVKIESKNLRYDPKFKAVNRKK